MRTLNLPPEIFTITGEGIKIYPLIQGKVARTCRIHSNRGDWVLKHSSNDQSRERLKRETRFLTGMPRELSGA